MPISKPDGEPWRRACGCMRTSEKLKNMLKEFPDVPPPTPTAVRPLNTYLASATTFKHNVEGDSIICPNVPSTGQIKTLQYPFPRHMARLKSSEERIPSESKLVNNKENVQVQAMIGKTPSVVWQLLVELIALLQLSVTATALTLYYIIYCYMQLVYYTLRSAVYFHNADMSMKITLTIVTVTSMLIGLQIVYRVERILGVKVFSQVLS